MVIEKFPPNKRRGNEDDNVEHETHVHHPEFIILEEDREKEGEGEFSKQEFAYLHTFHNLSKVNFPFFFRLLALGLSCVIFMLSFVVLALLSIGVVVGLMGLFRIEEMNKPMIRFWTIYRRMLVFSLGLFVAMFSPPLGFALILVYLFLLGEPVDGGLLQKIFLSRFRSE